MPLPIIAGVAAGVGALASLIGGLLKNGSLEEAKSIMNEAMAEYGPDVLPKLKVALQDYGVAESELSKITADPEGLSAQRRALRELQGVVDGGSNDAQFSLALRDSQVAASSDYDRRVAALREGMANRGTPLQLASAAGVNAAAQSANLQNNQGMQAAALAEQRKMQALRDLAGLGTQMRGQGFTEKSQAAKALDEMNRWNQQMRFDANNQYYQQLQQDFLRKMQLAGAKNEVRGAQAKITGAMGDNWQGLANNLGNSLSTFAGGVGQYMNAGQGAGQGGQAVGRSTSALEQYGGPPQAQPYEPEQWRFYDKNKSPWED